MSRVETGKGSWLVFATLLVSSSVVVILEWNKVRHKTDWQHERHQTLDVAHKYWILRVDVTRHDRTPYCLLIEGQLCVHARARHHYCVLFRGTHRLAREICKI